MNMKRIIINESDVQCAGCGWPFDRYDTAWLDDASGQVYCSKTCKDPTYRPRMVQESAIDLNRQGVIDGR